MLISVIIPVLNEARTLGRTLEIVDSLPGDKEVIAVDSGSSDGTTAIAEKYARLINSPRGRALQMNASAAAARGEVLLFLHADTLLPTDALEAVELSLKDASVVGGRFSVKLSNPGWRYRMVGWSINTRDRILGGFTGDQVIFIRRDVFNAIGGYPQIPLMEDLEFGRRMQHTGSVARLRQRVTTSARRWEKNGVLKTVFLMGVLRTLYYLSFPPSSLQRWYNDAR